MIESGFKNNRSMLKFSKVYALATIYYTDPDIDFDVKDAVQGWALVQFEKMNLPYEVMKQASDYNKFKKYWIENGY